MKFRWNFQNMFFKEDLWKTVSKLCNSNPDKMFLFLTTCLMETLQIDDSDFCIIRYILTWMNIL